MRPGAPEIPCRDSEKKDLDGHVTPCSYGFRTIRKAHQALVKVAEEAAIREDHKHVHRMRVASRRLRASLPIFKTCFPKKKYQKWYQEIKRITAALGTARDLDVQIEFLEEDDKRYQSSDILRDQTGREGRGISDLLRRLKRKRKRLQPKVEAVISSLANHGIYNEFLQIITNPALAEPGNEKPGDLNRKAQLKISSRVNSLLALESSVHIPDAVIEHHKMRISAKKLRYTLEVFNHLFSGEFKKAVRTMQALQDILGQIHDCDVWIADLYQFIGDDPLEREEQEGGGKVVWNHQEIRDLLDDRKQERDRLYHGFVEMWEGLREAQFFENLQLVVARPPPPGDHFLAR